MPSRRRRSIAGALPLLPVAPAIVVILGVAVALAVSLVGLSDLRRASEGAASLRAAALAGTLAARLRVTGSEDWAEIVQRVGRRSGADILLLDHDGQVVADASLGAPPQAELVRCLVAGSGGTETKLGRTRFAVRPLGPPLEQLSVVAFVPSPATPPEAAALAKAVAALTALLVGAAGAVAFGFAKDVRDDVDYVQRRVVAMARADANPAGEVIPIRGVDQVGRLTAAFNLLVERFAAAERTYRQDLDLAAAHDRERSAFLAALSHELRTPLNAILGFADVLLSEVDGPLDPGAREDLVVVRTSAAHLASLIDDILDLSALESGDLRLERRPVDLFAVAEQVVREAEPLAAGKKLALSLHGAPGEIAHADPRRVRQVLGNLVGNAVKFTRSGCVVVEVARRGRFIAVTTSDTGPGIAPAERAAIFEEYRQSGDLAARRAGTGLGLAIARRIVEMHGGAIDVESAVGKGSRFTVTFPVHARRTEGTSEETTTP